MAKSSTSFKRGASGNPNGRPKRKTEQAFLKATIASVSIKEWKEIVKVAIEQAMKGDDRARKWLSDWVLGTPQKNVDMTIGIENLDTMTDDELQSIIES